MHDSEVRVVVELIALASAVAAISMTIGEAKMFKWLRDAAHARSATLAYFLSCPYCVSHYVAFGFVAILDAVLLRTGTYVLDVFLNGMVVVGISPFFKAKIYRVTFPHGKDG